MSEPNKIDLTQYLPIRFGWLKFWPVTLMFVAWVLSISHFRFLPKHYPNWWPLFASSYFVLGLVAIIVLWVSGKNPAIWDFCAGYWRRNIVSYVVLFVLSSSGNIQAYTRDSGNGELNKGDILWLLPLGGWCFWRRPRLFFFLGQDHFEGRFKLSWYLEPLSRRVCDFRDCKKMKVRLKDREGFALAMLLPEALTHIMRSESGSLADFFRDYQSVRDSAGKYSCQMEQLAELVESVLREFHDRRRFGNSIRAREMVERLKAELAEIVPERHRLQLP